MPKQVKMNLVYDPVAKELTDANTGQVHRKVVTPGPGGRIKAPSRRWHRLTRADVEEILTELQAELTGQADLRARLQARIDALPARATELSHLIAFWEDQLDEMP